MSNCKHPRMSKSYGSTVWRCDACNEDVSSLVVTIPTITDEQAEILILRAKLRAAERIADFHRTFAGHVYIKNEDLAAKCVLSREVMARAEAAEAAASRYCTLVDQYRSRAEAAEAEVEDAQRLSKIADDHIGMLQAEVARLREALEELIEVSDLRGDIDEIPHPCDDPKLWTARLISAWDNARAALEAKQ